MDGMRLPSEEPETKNWRGGGGGRGSSACVQVIGELVQPARNSRIVYCFVTYFMK